jgi:hypothetical protein
MSLLRLRDLRPLRSIHKNFFYQSLNSESQNASPSGSCRRKWSTDKLRFGRFSLKKILALAIATLVLFTLMASRSYRHIKKKELQRQQQPEPDEPVPFVWQACSRLDGYYNGIRTLVPYTNVTIENRYNQSAPPRYEKSKPLNKHPPIDPIIYNPYPDYKSSEYLKNHYEVHECFSDDDDTISVPDVYAYPRVPKVYPKPLYGSYLALGMRKDVCFDGFGRLGAYGYGDPASELKDHIGQKSEKVGSEKIFQKTGHTDHTYAVMLRWNASHSHKSPRLPHVAHLNASHSPNVHIWSCGCRYETCRASATVGVYHNTTKTHLRLRRNVLLSKIKP